MLPCSAVLTVLLFVICGGFGAGTANAQDVPPGCVRGFNLAGTDLPNMPIPKPDVASCLEACLDDASCQLLVYLQNEQGCWLKATGGNDGDTSARDDAVACYDSE